MKKQILVIAAIVLTLTACKNDAKLISGEYSYKTSGTAEISGDNISKTVDLPNSIGELSIIDLKTENKDSVMLVFNELTGNLLIVNAQIVGDTIKMNPHRKNISLLSIGIGDHFDTKVEGYGVRHKNNIIFRQTYDGVLQNDSIRMTLHSDDVTTVANCN